MEYGTGLAVEIPEGHVGLLFPRSSISNSGLILTNSVGVIDSGYRGEIKFRFKHIPDTAYYKPGDRIGQLIVMPYPEIDFQEVEELSSTERGEGGFGSSGN
jgi:dUTP pyrophosphatase